MDETPGLPCEPQMTPGSENQRAVGQAILARAGDVGTWEMPPGYPQSLALCIIDSIQSIGVRYRSVENVVRKYRDYRGVDRANRDGAPDLLGVFEHLGVDGFMKTIGNAHRTSSRNGVLKAEVIREAATLLVADAPTIDEFRQRAHDDDLKSQWLALSGQGSGISWRYALMLAGVPGVKADRMVRSFVGKALGRDPRSFGVRELEELVIGAAEHLRIHPTLADHLIWRVESGRKPRTMTEPDLGDYLTPALMAEAHAGRRVNVLGDVTNLRVETTPAGLAWATFDLETKLDVIRAAASPIIWARHEQDLKGGQIHLIADRCTTKDGRPGLWVRGVQPRSTGEGVR